MILAFVGMFGNAFIQTCRSFEAENDRELEAWPHLTASQIDREFKELLAVVDAAPQSCEEYFTVLHRITALEGSVRLYSTKHPPLDPRYVSRDDISVRWQIENKWTDSQRVDALIVRFGVEAYTRARDSVGMHNQYRANLPQPSRPSTWQEWTWWMYQACYWWIVAHLVAILFMPGHLALKARDSGSTLQRELGANFPRLMLAVLVPEWGLVKYRIADPAKQIMDASRLALKFATWVLATCLSVFTSTGKLVRASELDERGGGSETVLVHKARYSFSTITLPAYIGFMDGGAFRRGMVQQSEFTVALPSGLYFDQWSSFSLDKRGEKPNFGDELDYTIGISGKIGRGIFRRFRLQYNLSATYLDVYSLFKLPRGDVINLGAFLGREFKVAQGSVTPYIWVRKAMPAKGKEPAGGTFVMLGSRFQRALKGRLSVGGDMSFNHDSGAFGFNEGWIGRVAASANWKVSGHLTLQAPFVQFSTPLTHTGDGRKTEIPVGIGFSYSW